MNIKGVFVKPLDLNVDDRGVLFEMTRLDWPECDILNEIGDPSPEDRIQQVYVVANTTNAVRAFHKHHYLVDLFCIVQGHAKFVLVDDRKDSHTLGQMDVINVSYLKPTLIGVPSGVLHGWRGSIGSVLISVANKLYCGKDRLGPLDEVRIPWDAYGKEVWETYYK